MVLSLDEIEDAKTEHVLTKEDQWNLFEDDKREAVAKEKVDTLIKQQELEVKAKANELAKQQQQKE